MKRRSDTEAPAILLNCVLGKAVGHRVSVLDIEDVVDRRAEVEPAKRLWREERQIGDRVAAGEIAGQRTPRTHVLRVHCDGCSRPEDRKMGVRLQHVRRRIREIDVRDRVIRILEGIRQPTRETVTTIHIQLQLYPSGVDLVPVVENEETVARVEMLVR